MAEDRKRGGPSGANWIAIRTAYIVKHWSAAKCAAEFNLHETTVKTRAAKEGWAQERDRNTTNATEVATAEAREVVSEAAAELRQSHEAFVSWALRLVKESETDLSEITNARSRIESRRAILEMVDRGTRLSRLVRGLRDGVPSDESDAVAGIPLIELFSPEPKQDREVS